jgi:alpha-beta hydrolase superfamily lysophospholipase
LKSIVLVAIFYFSFDCFEFFTNLSVTLGLKSGARDKHHHRARPGLVRRAGNRQRRLPFDNVTRRVYPGLHHETHNEPSGASVVDDTARWILSELESRATT